MGNVKGVGVDDDAKPLNDPVTVLVTPEGHEIDADDWSHANNLHAAGAHFKQGYPTAPGEEPTTATVSRPQASSVSTGQGSSGQAANQGSSTQTA